MLRAAEIVLPRKVHADWLFNTNENRHLRNIIQTEQVVFRTWENIYIYQQLRKRPRLFEREQRRYMEEL